MRNIKLSNLLKMPSGYKLMEIYLMLAILASYFYILIYFKKSRQIEILKDKVIVESKASISKYTSIWDISPVWVPEVNCKKLFKADPEEMMKANSSPDYPQRVRDDDFNRLISNCETFKRQQGYILKPVSVEEKAFPIAFSILLYKDILQVERLLRALYRPQNYYCLHVDAKSPVNLHRSVATLANCFENVFVASRQVRVYWGSFSVIEPDLICMEDLLQRKNWKYFINLTGQEWPLKTNLDLVKILQIYGGANDISGVPFSNSDRVTKRRIYYKWTKTGERIRNRRHPPFKWNITMVKGAVHIAASRAYVDCVINDPVAREFREWCRDTGHASEHFFNSLQYSPQLGVPGSFRGKLQPANNRVKSLLRWKKWSSSNYTCNGKYKRNICIPGYDDMPSIGSGPELFLNKLHYNYKPLVMDCLEELHYNHTRDDLTGRRHLNLSIYEQLDFVLNYRQFSRNSTIPTHGIQ